MTLGGETFSERQIAGVAPLPTGETRAGWLTHEAGPRHTIAALYVQRGGSYWNLPGVDAWDEARDGCELPELEWGIGEPQYDPAVVDRMGLARAKRLGEVGARGGGTDSSPRISSPPAFRDLLLNIARTAIEPAEQCASLSRLSAETPGAGHNNLPPVFSLGDSRGARPFIHGEHV